MKTHALLFATTMFVAPVAVFAQEAPEQFDNEEIVVTAQNRTQNVQDVPIAISVVSGEALVEAGVTDFASITKVAPSVNIVADTTQTRVSIRGIGSNSNGETQDQAVSINIDGEYINRPTVLNASLFDLDRVEVLRGPQGTLYGRNSTGGAINFIMRKPGNDFGANGSASYGNFDQLTIQGGVDVPLGSIGAIRASGIYSTRDGYNIHPNTNTRSGDENTKAGRISLRLEPVAGLTINAAAERIETRETVSAQAWVNLNDAGLSPGVGCVNTGWVDAAPLIAGGQCVPVRTNNLASIDRHSYNSPNNGVGFNNSTSTAVRGSLVYDFGPAAFTYRGGYRETDRVGDTTLSPAYVFKNFKSDIKTQSHEVRLNGDTGPLVWQVGAFLFKEDQVIDRGLFNGSLPAFLLGANGGYINYFRRPFVKAESKAVFGQTDIVFSDALTAVVGVRYTDDKRSAIYETLGSGLPGPARNPALFNSGPVQITAPATAAQSSIRRAAADKFTWTAGLNFTPNTDTLIYGKVSTGFKAGGFDEKGTYAPETNTSYEVGAKLGFGDTGQHLFNIAGFYNDYKDLQVAVLIDNALGAQIFNAGKATIWGIEAETVIALSDSDTFTASVNYVNAEYKELLAEFPIFCVGCTPTTTTVSDLDPGPAIVNPNLAGNTPPITPRFTITVGYDKEIGLGNAGSLTASVYTTFKSSYFNDIFNFKDSKQEAFTQTDLSLTWKPESEKFTVQAFVRNLEDTRAITYAGFTAAGNDRIYNWQFGAPRTYGVRVGFDF